MTQAGGGARSVTFLTPEDLEPIQAQLDDHETRIKALEAGGGPGPTPPPSGATLVIGTWYSDMGKFADMAAKGFTHVHEWAYTDGGSLGLLDKAHAYGMKVALELSWCMEGNRFHQDRLDWTCLPAYINHPALAYWLSYDEPDLRQTPTAEMKKIYDAIKAKDPNHPVKLTIRYPWKSTGQPYIPFGDIISVDPYPIPWGPPTQAGSETAQAVASAGLGTKAMFTDLQTFSWKNTFPQNVPPGRLPTMQEVEVMGTTSIQAQTHKQKGVFCYLEDELMTIPGDLKAVVGKWRALVPTAMAAAAPTETEAKKKPETFAPLPKHPAIDALKAKMKDEKRRHYPNPKS